YRDRITESVAKIRELASSAVGGSQFFNLAPLVSPACVPLENIGCTLSGVVSLSPYNNCVIANPDRSAEGSVCRTIGGNQVFNLAPLVGPVFVPFENIGCTFGIIIFMRSDYN